MKTRLQKNCLLLSLACFAVAMAIMLYCCTIGGHYIGSGVCRHDAFVSAWVAEDAGYETRIMFGVAKSGSGFHEQAEAKINGKWVPLHAEPIRVYTDQRDEQFIPDEPIDPLFCLPGKWKNR